MKIKINNEIKLNIWKIEFEGDNDIDEYNPLLLSLEIYSYLTCENNLRYSIGKGTLWTTKNNIKDIKKNIDILFFEQQILKCK